MVPDFGFGVLLWMLMEIENGFCAEPQ